jgi:hypothetical protein
MKIKIFRIIKKLVHAEKADSVAACKAFSDQENLKNQLNFS